MGLEATTLKVVVKASTGDTGLQLQKLAKKVSDFAGKTAAAASQIAGLGSVITGALGGAVVVAAKHNEALAGSLQRIKDAGTTLAVEVGGRLAPEVEGLASKVESLVARFQSLSEEQVQSALDAAVLAVQISAVSLAVGKLAALSKVLIDLAVVLGPTLAAVFSGATLAGFLAALPLVLSIGAAIGGVTLAVGALYEAFGKEGFLAAFEAIGDFLKRLGVETLQTFGLVFGKLGGFVSNLLKGIGQVFTWLLDRLLSSVRVVAKVLAPIADFLKLDGLANDLRRIQDVTAESLMGGLGDLAVKAGGVLQDAGIALGEGILYGVGQSVKGLKRLAGDVTGGKGAGAGGTYANKAGKTLEEQRKAAEQASLDAAKEHERVAKEIEDRIERIEVLAQQESDAAAQAHDDELKRIREISDAIDDEAWAWQRSITEAIRSANDRMLQGLGTAGSLFQIGRAGASEDPRVRGGELGAVGLAAGAQFGSGMTGAGMSAAMGGIIAVVLELLQRSEQFKGIIQALSNFLGLIADSLGKVFTALEPILGALFIALEPIVSALGTFVASLTAPLTALVPAFVIIGQLMQVLAPILGVVAQLVMAVQQPLMLLAGPVLSGLFEVLKQVGIWIMDIAIALSQAWNWVIKGIQSIINKIAGALPDFLGKHIRKLGSGLDSVILPVDDMKNSLRDLQGMSEQSARDLAQAKFDEVLSMEKLGAAAQDAAESLLNVPSGFKVQLARFNATDPGGGGMGFGTSAPAAPVVDNSRTTITINAPNATAEDVAREVVRLTEREAIRREGIRTRVGARTGRD